MPSPTFGNRTPIAILAFILFPLFLSAQLLSHRQGEILVQLPIELSAERFVQSLPAFAGKRNYLTVDRRVSAPVNIWLLKFDWATLPENELLDLVRRHPRVIGAQFNHFVGLRSTLPDDPLFEDQWQHMNTGQDGGTVDADMDTDLAWDITTGGLTPNGDTIVVAVLDDGADLDHPDLAPNLWVNHAEIPDNGIDDDNNGYIDDHLGWNSQQDNDNVGTGGGHGTPVAGIIGAVGNNGIGVTGISWDVKVMVIKNNFNTDEAAVLSAYSYPLIQRIRYNESAGAEGAFVVATNASWGINNGQPDASPLWCNFYDTLGVHGVLSVGATANANIDVDVDGDLPTACASDYLLSVTNMNRNDMKVNGAAFGLTTIDLGAFGSQAFTTSVGDNYGPFGGTSGAAPQVTGTIGLLYSVPCPELGELMISDPAATALYIRQAILDGVDPNESLDSITVTGGRLNIFNSAQLLVDQCGGCIPPSVVRIEDITVDEATISWNTNSELTQVDLRFRLLGDTAWIDREAVSSPYQLDNLFGCNEYELQLVGFCGPDSTATTAISQFTTDGCCELPPDFRFTAADSMSIEYEWSGIVAASQYLVRYRPEGVSDWTEVSVTNTGGLLTELMACTEYELQLQTDCDSTATEYSSSTFVQTLGCGICLDDLYCRPVDTETEEEWIAYVKIGDGIENETNANSPAGYGNYTDPDGDSPTFEAGLNYDFTLTPGYSGTQYGEYIGLYIDLDRDFDFTEDERLIAAEDINTTFTTTFKVPEDAEPGASRLRVIMNFAVIDDACPGPDDNYGEVEDYCVELTNTGFCALPAAVDTLLVGMDSMVIAWESIGDATAYRVRYRPSAGGDWIEVMATDAQLVLDSLEACTAYTVELSTVCGGAFTDYGLATEFMTRCVSSSQELVDNRYWQVFPNPTRDRLQLRWQGPRTYDANSTVELIGLTGQTLASYPWQRGAPLVLSLADRAPGIYYVRLLRAGAAPLVKRIVLH